MAQRFVILEHTVNGAAHFDLMLEVEGQELLRTYQLATWPLGVGESCSCRKLDDHRRAYLDYEGEVSGGRGVVRRIAAGRWSGDLRLEIDGEVVGLSMSGDSASRVV